MLKNRMFMECVCVCHILVVEMANAQSPYNLTIGNVTINRDIIVSHLQLGKSSQFLAFLLSKVCNMTKL